MLILLVYTTTTNDACNTTKAWRTLTSPTREWGPALVKHRRLVDYVPGFVVDPWTTEVDSTRYQEDPRTAQYINHALDLRNESVSAITFDLSPRLVNILEVGIISRLAR